MKAPALSPGPAEPPQPAAATAASTTASPPGTRKRLIGEPYLWGTHTGARAGETALSPGR
jgi:hypothetical protein